MSSLALLGGTNFFSGFTKLCKGLAVVLVVGHAVVQIFPSSIIYLTLIPARTIPFAWNLLTAGYVEQTIYGTVISTLGLLFMGKLLEPIWGSKEFLKFVVVVNFLTSICVFTTEVTFYYITWRGTYLYTPLSGFHGVLLGFLVGLKQIVPEQELSLFSVMKIKAKWLPSIVLFFSIILCFVASESTAYLPSMISGTYMSWIYLRFLQKKPESKIKGDPSDEFAFSTFFPEFLRPIIDPVASVLARALCGRSDTSSDGVGYTFGGDPLPGSDPIEASRRRERGARALEERLAAERLVSGSAEEERGNLADNV